VERNHRQRVALVAYLRQSRAQILSSWRQLVEQDPELTTAQASTRAQFTDSIPKVLDAFEEAVRADDAMRETRAALEQRQGASEHGLHRWQQGYDLRETMREWAHLHQCILAQLESYAERAPDLEESVMRHARQVLVRLCGEGACESASRYSRLQQAEAAGRMRDLDAAVRQLDTLARERASLLREAAHDLRGSVGIITNATAVLARATTEEARSNFFRILDNALGSTHALLNDLIELTRLEAGQDRLVITQFDVSELLRSLSDALRSEASARSLFFKVDGPDALMVQGDAAKLQRVVQNLVLNAIRATESGGVQLCWQAPRQPDASHWTLLVEDTGPGLQGTHATPLTRALHEATDQRHADPIGEAPATEAKPREATETEKTQEPGEGIGLSIVKRLCELLGARIDLQTAVGRGTRFQLSFPVRLVPPR
jgi:signal transduction histidine kinase